MASKTSKFSSIFEPEEETVTEDIAPDVEEWPTSTLEPVAQQDTPEQGSTPPRRMGRPATGKKSNPNYRQVTAYVRKDLYKSVSDALYDESRGVVDAKRKEFSELVDELLEAWLKDQSKPKHRTA